MGGPQSYLILGRQQKKCSDRSVGNVTSCLESDKVIYIGRRGEQELEVMRDEEMEKEGEGEERR